MGGAGEILAVKQRGDPTSPKSPKAKKERKPSPKRSMSKSPLEEVKGEKADDPKPIVKEEGADLSTKHDASSLQDSRPKGDPTRILKRGETLTKSDPKPVKEGGDKEEVKESQPISKGEELKEKTKKISKN